VHAPYIWQRVCRGDYYTGVNTPDQMQRDIAEDIPAATIVLADNIFAYIKEHKGIDPTGMVVCPPFNNLWIEAHDRRQFAAEDGSWRQEDDATYGAWVTTKHRRKDRDDFDAIFSGFELEAPREDAERVVAVVPFTSVRGRRGGAVNGGVCAIAFALDASGMMIGGFKGADFSSNEQAWAIENVHWQVIQLVLSTLAFFNIRNVVVTDHLPSRQERRRASREGRPDIVWKTLQVVKPGATTSGQPRTATQAEIAEHICRGHIKHFTEEKPMFGNPKITGAFWIEAHMRGSRRHGVVAKDYAVAQESR
jgi:hypothetical protein